jgi:hypothetical protein
MGIINSALRTVGKGLRGASQAAQPFALEKVKEEILAKREERLRRFKTLTPEQTTNAGLPSGTVAQQNAYGRINTIYEPPQEKQESIANSVIRGEDGLPMVNETYLEAQERLEGIKNHNKEPSLQEIYDETSPTGSRFVPKSQAINQPGKGPSPSTSERKYQEMIDLGIPKTVAVGVTYGTVKEIRDQRGQPALIDVASGELIGSMERDRKTMKYKWVSNLGNSEHQRTPITLDQLPSPEYRKVGAVYQTQRGPMKWMGNGWAPQ